MVGMSSAAAAQIQHTHSEGPMMYNGMIDCFVKTVRHEGYGALFKVREAFRPLGHGESADG